MIKGLYPFGLNHYRSLKFQKLRKLISKNQKKILIQNAWRSDENKFFEKRYLINFYVDYILTHNFSIKKKYQNIISKR